MFLFFSVSFLCFFRQMFVLNALEHTMHWYGLRLVWTLWCCSSSPLPMKFLPQWRHLCGFSPVWVLWCRDKLVFWLKPFPQKLHLYGFWSASSLPWVFWCRDLFPLEAKDLLHLLQEYGLYPVSVLWCSANDTARLNFLRQMIPPDS